MYKDGWWLAVKTRRIPWVLTPDALAPFRPGVWNPDDDPVELYYLPDDFSQARDLAADNPEKVQELTDLFWAEAEKYQVLPLLAPLGTFFGYAPPLPDVAKLEFRPDVQNVMPGMIPRIYNHSYTISADLIVPPQGVQGVIVAEADHLGGFSLFVDDGRLTHTYSMMGVFIYRQQATEPLPVGEVNVRLQFEADAPKPATGGQVTLYVNDKPVGGGRMEHTVPVRFSGVRRHGRRPRQRRRGRPQLRRPQAVRVHRHDQEGRLRRQTSPVNRRRAGPARGSSPRPRGARARGIGDRGTRGGMTMIFDDETIDVLIAGYLSRDAAHDDFESVRHSGGYLHGATVVSRDLEGNLVGGADRPPGA